MSHAGFRDDKIPLSMLVTQCGGQQKFKYTVMEEIMLSTITPVGGAGSGGCGGEEEVGRAWTWG